MYPEIVIDFIPGTLVLSSYRLFFLLAGITVIITSVLLLRRLGLSIGKITILLIPMILAVPAGARLLHLITNPDIYIKDPTRIWSLELTGFALMGGLVLATAVGIITARLLKLDPWQMADHIAPGLGMGLAVMRVGCFLNGCCFGMKTKLPWAVHFPIGSIPYKYYLAESLARDSFLPFALLQSPGIHPTQLYELTAALLIAAAALIMLRRKAPTGAAFLVSAILFAGFRWFNSTLRVPAATLDIAPWFYPVLYGGIILLSLLLLINQIIKKRVDEQAVK